MKKYLLIILVSFFMLGIFDVRAFSDNKKTIVIDPGHGGLDPGTVYQDIYEKDINLKISIYLKKYLIKKGYRVLLTRDNDYDLSKPKAIYRKKSDFDNRINLINNNADYYLSIHLHYLNDSRYYGIQVFSKKKDYEDASKVQNFLNNRLNGNRKNKIIPNDTYMYSKLNKPGLLIECGFLSNSNERSKLLIKEYQNKIAKEIANSIKLVSF